MDEKRSGMETKNDIVNGKSITFKADRKLKELRKIINDGSFKPAYSERDIVSIALMEFPTQLIESLRESRVSGKDLVLQGANEIYQEYQNSGGELDFNSYLKSMIAPLILSKKNKRSKATQKKRTAKPDSPLEDSEVKL